MSIGHAYSFNVGIGYNARNEDVRQLKEAIERLHGFLDNLLEPEITVDEICMRRSKVRKVFTGREE